MGRTPGADFCLHASESELFYYFVFCLVAFRAFVACSLVNHCTLCRLHIPVGQRYGKEQAVVGVDKDKKVVTLSGGRQIQYDALISTLPLDIMLSWLDQPQWSKGLTRRCVILPLCTFHLVAACVYHSKQGPTCAVCLCGTESPRS